MSILETDAVILSDMPQGETSKIIRVFSKDYGRLSLIAKGARKLKNRFGGSLDPLNHVHIVYYYKDNRDLHIVTQCDIINPYSAVKKHLEKLTIGLSIAEIIVNLVVEEESNTPLFDLMNRSLEALENAEKNFINIYWYFLTRFLQLSGFGLNPAERDCQNCGSEIQKHAAYFSMSRGGMLCSSCSQPNVNRRISGETVQVLKQIVNREPEQLVNLHVSHRSIQEFNSILDNYYRYHFDGYVSPQSIKLLM